MKRHTQTIHHIAVVINNIASGVLCSGDKGLDDKNNQTNPTKSVNVPKHILMRIVNRLALIQTMNQKHGGHNGHNTDQALQTVVNIMLDNGQFIRHDGFYFYQTKKFCSFCGLLK